MVRHYIRKKVDNKREEAMQNVYAMFKDKMPLKVIADQSEYSYSNIKRLHRKYRNYGKLSHDYKNNSVFNSFQEAQIVIYLKKQINASLYGKQIRILAYRCAKHFNMSRPNSWDINEIAGADWFYGFNRRNPSLNIAPKLTNSLENCELFTNFLNYLEQLPSSENVYFGQSNSEEPGNRADITYLKKVLFHKNGFEENWPFINNEENFNDFLKINTSFLQKNIKRHNKHKLIKSKLKLGVYSYPNDGLNVKKSLQVRIEPLFILPPYITLPAITPAYAEFVVKALSHPKGHDFGRESTKEIIKIPETIITQLNKMDIHSSRRITKWRIAWFSTLPKACDMPNCGPKCQKPLPEEIPLFGSPCGHLYCELGCICASLNKPKLKRRHCKKFDCMLECTCSSDGQIRKSSNQTNTNAQELGIHTLRLSNRVRKRTFAFSDTFIQL